MIDNSPVEPAATVRPKIVVVGTCASGKSTLVGALLAAGVQAYACAQEHSQIATLWNHYEPAFVVFLEADLRTIRKRRSPTWPATIYRAQRRRLVSARRAARLIIDTSKTDVATSVQLVLESME